MKALVLSLSILVAASASAQTVPKEFPADGTTSSAAALKERFAGKVYATTLADGTSWHIDYKSSGYFFIDTSTGFHGSGDWHADDGKLCSRLRGATLSCNDVRAVGEVIYLKRDSGEVIALSPK